MGRGWMGPVRSSAREYFDLLILLKYEIEKVEPGTFVYPVSSYSALYSVEQYTNVPGTGTQKCTVLLSLSWEITP